MGASPKTVNSRGQVLTDDMKDILYGGSGHRLLGDDMTARGHEIFMNWLLGPAVKPVDPTEAFGRGKELSGVSKRSAAGMGMAGLFGFSKSIGSDTPDFTKIDHGFTGLPGLLERGGNSLFSPMAKGVPYSVPPLPKIGSPFGKGGG